MWCTNALAGLDTRQIDCQAWGMTNTNSQRTIACRERLGGLLSTITVRTITLDPAPRAISTPYTTNVFAHNPAAAERYIRELTERCQVYAQLETG